MKKLLFLKDSYNFFYLFAGFFLFLKTCAFTSRFDKDIKAICYWLSILNQKSLKANERPNNALQRHWFNNDFSIRSMIMVLLPGVFLILVVQI
jgi:uncharacterized membrane protein YjjP (DUF1212 family)